MRQVLELPTGERARFAQELIASLDDDTERGDSEVQAAWQVEITKRIADVREGRVALEDGEAVLEELEAELAVSGSDS